MISSFTCAYYSEGLDKTGLKATKSEEKLQVCKGSDAKTPIPLSSRLH